MFLKRRTRRKDGKDHTYYSVCESLRVHGGRTVQRQLLHLGELNTNQHDAWQHTLAVLHEDGSRHQRRLFTDAAGGAPAAADVVEVKLSTFAVKSPRRFGDCWAGCHAWQQLGLRAFWEQQLAADAGDVPWAKVLELLAGNRLLNPRSELYVHENGSPRPRWTCSSTPTRRSRARTGSTAASIAAGRTSPRSSSTSPKSGATCSAPPAMCSSTI